MCVNFVGAGPGAVDLITLRGKALLEKADVIIYAGSLVNISLLDFAKRNCEMFNSAKMTLLQVLDTMESAFLEGKEVVRLHTGDPCLYGALQEQIDGLDARGIPYNICPGVSSFCAAAASLKAEYTLPGVSQTLIITRAPGRTAVPEKESLYRLAAHNASMTLFLSGSLLDAAAKELIAGGYPADTPAAIVYKASWPEERIIHCTLETLNDKALENNITKTALVCIGSFLKGEYELSRLYAPDFSTEYREGIK